MLERGRPHRNPLWQFVRGCGSAVWWRRRSYGWLHGARRQDEKLGAARLAVRRRTAGHARRRRKKGFHLSARKARETSQLKTLFQLTDEEPEALLRDAWGPAGFPVRHTP